MIKKDKLRKLLIMTFLILSFSGYAQDEPPVDDGGSDDFPAAPIDDYILPMALLGITAAGYWLIRKEKSNMIEQRND